MGESGVRTKSPPGWTWLEFVGVGVAAFGTLPFAYLLYDLLLPGVSYGAITGDSAAWLAVFGGVAVVGWTLLLLSERDRRRRQPARPDVVHAR
jgi:hypothetical protein